MQAARRRRRRNLSGEASWHLDLVRRSDGTFTAVEDSIKEIDTAITQPELRTIKQDIYQIDPRFPDLRSGAGPFTGLQHRRRSHNIAD